MTRINISNEQTPDNLAKAVKEIIPNAATHAEGVVELITKSNAGRPSGVLTQGSATETVSKMEVGETVALARRLPKNSRADVEKLYAGMSATLQSASRRAGQGVAEFEVKIERGEFKTKDRSTMLVVAVTRVS